MDFKININIERQAWLDYQTPILAVGSCFAENMASKLAEDRFDVLENPLGILYNPISLANLLLNETQSHATELVEVDGGWKSWEAHGRVAETSRTALEKTILEHKASVRERLQQGGISLVTFGTAWVHTSLGQVVANCHKQPAHLFQKHLLEVSTITGLWSKVLETYPASTFIFTVSPVRYKRDGWNNSHVSKGVLHLAVKTLVENFANAVYFPAYELVLDELRDYRFYDRDLVHPNDLAIDYVYERFKASFFNAKTTEMVEAWEPIKRMNRHRLMGQSEASRTFEKDRNAKLEAFNDKYF